MQNVSSTTKSTSIIAEPMGQASNVTTSQLIQTRINPGQMRAQRALQVPPNQPQTQTPGRMMTLGAVNQPPAATGRGNLARGAGNAIKLV